MQKRGWVTDMADVPVKHVETNTRLMMASTEKDLVAMFTNTVVEVSRIWLCWGNGP